MPELIVVCPKPIAWNRVYQELIRAAKEIAVNSPEPPVPLILAGWFFSNDYDKQERWQETVEWARMHSLTHVLNIIHPNEWERVASLSNYRPFAYSSYRSEPSPKPTPERVTEMEQLLARDWESIVGPLLGSLTRPIRLTGSKRCRLLVAAKAGSWPPWGTWTSILSRDGSFTRFRAAINSALKPHQVDHIQFKVE